MNHNKNFIICGDYGGTCFSIAVYSASGELIHENDFRAKQFSVFGLDECVKIINDSLKKIPLNKKSISALSIGISGLRYNKDKEAMSKKLKLKTGIKNILSESDAITALEGAFMSEDGAILISGTGSVIYGKYKDKIFRAGGWGRYIGDEGSGYWIGAEALNKLGIFFDYGISNRYTKFFEKEFGITSGNMLDKIYKDNFKISSAAEKIILAKSHDANLFKDILVSAADNLALLISDYINISKCTLPIKVALSGSTINNENRLTRYLHEAVKKYFGKKVILINPQNTPHYGAFLLAKKKFKIL